MKTSLILSLLTLTLSLTGSTAGYPAVRKIDENTASLTKNDLNQIRQTLQEAQYLRTALERERQAYDQLTAARAYLDAERDAQVRTYREQVTAMQRAQRQNKAPHLIAFAEAFKNRKYESDFRVGLRLEWKLL